MCVCVSRWSQTDRRPGRTTVWSPKRWSTCLAGDTVHHGIPVASDEREGESTDELIHYALCVRMIVELCVRVSACVFANFSPHFYNLYFFTVSVSIKLCLV